MENHEGQGVLHLVSVMDPAVGHCRASESLQYRLAASRDGMACLHPKAETASYAVALRRYLMVMRQTRRYKVKAVASWKQLKF